MNTHDTNAVTGILSRRDFVRASFRYPLLAVLAGVTCVLVTRRVQTPALGECLKLRLCRECRIIQRCDRPPAVQFRATLSAS